MTTPSWAPRRRSCTLCGRRERNYDYPLHLVSIWIDGQVRRACDVCRRNHALVYTCQSCRREQGGQRHKRGGLTVCSECVQRIDAALYETTARAKEDERMAHQGELPTEHVVPLHPSELYGSTWSAEEAAAAAGEREPRPQLTYRGGPLLGAVEVSLVFWGPGWDTQADVCARLQEFWLWVVTSPLLEGLAEYSVPGGTQIGAGRCRGVTLLPDDPGASVSDGQLRQLLCNLVAKGTLPEPEPASLYVVYTQPGTAVQQNGDQSCTTFCGYHDAIPGDETRPALCYAVVPYPDCSGCRGPLEVFEALCVTSSHELCEAITDPVPGSGWYDDTYGEIGDICSWTTKQLGPYTVQKEWSNAAGACT